MTNPTPHGQVPDALRLAEEITNLECSSEAVAKTIAAAADELCRLHVENASLRASPAASPTPQALSAAPAGWKLVPVNPTPEMWKAAKSVPDPTPPYPPHYGLVWDAMLAASPTPPAEQQATKETSGGFHVWRDISTAPKDGSRFVATGHNYGLYSEVRHTCVAQWFRGCWMEASDWNETSELKYLTHWMPLPSPPDDVAAPAEQQAAPKTAPGEQNTVPAEWLEQAYREAWAACRDAETIGEEAEDWAFVNSTANSRMIGAQQAAPQPAPESIRSILIRCREFIDTTKVPAYPAGADLADEIDVLLAAQPAPAPLSDAIEHYLESQDALDNREYAGINAESYETLIRRRNASRKDLDAALAAQGGKDA